ncbi:MAG: GNAT family N-acetyltransferase [Cyanobacteria bacterium J06621_11]
MFTLAPSVQLKSARLHLRHGQPEDIPEILNYYRTNQAYLAPFEPLKPSTFYTAKHWEEELPLRLSETKMERSLKLFLFPKRTPNSIIGTLNFSNCVRGVFQSCTVGYSLAESYQGQGYMSEALKVGVDYVFSQLRLHRISANYLPHNQRSGQLLKRLGFRVEGYAYDYLYINGQWQDHVLTSLINSDFSS